jgi:hypothetical protein
MFTEAQLVSFGNYLLKKYGVQEYSTDGSNTPIHQRQVGHADVCNWKKAERPTLLPLPSAFQIGDHVKLSIFGADLPGQVLTVHFYESKVKYDVCVYDLDEIGTPKYETRLYNIDSAFVTKNQ